MAKKQDYASQLMVYEQSLSSYMPELSIKAIEGKDLAGDDIYKIPKYLIEAINSDATAAEKILASAATDIPKLKEFHTGFTKLASGPSQLMNTYLYTENDGNIWIPKAALSLILDIVNYMANTIHIAANSSIMELKKLNACEVSAIHPDDIVPVSKYCSGAQPGAIIVKKVDFYEPKVGMKYPITDDAAKKAGLKTTPIQKLYHIKTDNNHVITEVKPVLKPNGNQFIQSYTTNIQHPLNVHFLSPSFHKEGDDVFSAIEYHDSYVNHHGSAQRLQGVRERLEKLGFLCHLGTQEGLTYGKEKIIYCNIDNISDENIRTLATYFSMLLDADIAPQAADKNWYEAIRDKLWEKAQELNAKYGDSTWSSGQVHKPNWGELKNEWEADQKYKKNILYNQVRELLLLRDKHHMIEEKYGIPNGAKTLQGIKEILENTKKADKILAAAGWGNFDSEIVTLNSYVKNKTAANIAGLSDGIGHELHNKLTSKLAHAGTYGGCSTSGPISNINVGNLAYCEGVLEGTSAFAPGNNQWQHTVAPNLFSIYQGEEDFPNDKYTFQIKSSGNKVWDEEIRKYLKSQGFTCSGSMCQKATDDLEFIRRMALFLSNLKGANEEIGNECAKKAIIDASAAAVEQNKKGVFAFTQTPIMSNKKAWVEKCFKQYGITPPGMTEEEKKILSLIGPNKVYAGCNFENSDVLPDVGVIKYCEGVRPNPDVKVNAYFYPDGSLQHYFHGPPQAPDKIADVIIEKDPKSGLYTVALKNIDLRDKNAGKPMQQQVIKRLKEQWKMKCPTDTSCSTSNQLSDDDLRFLASYLSSFHHAYDVEPSCIKAAEEFAFQNSSKNIGGMVTVWKLPDWNTKVCEKGGKPVEPVETPKPGIQEAKAITPKYIMKLAADSKGVKGSKLAGCKMYTAKKLTLVQAAYCAGAQSHIIADNDIATNLSGPVFVEPSLMYHMLDKETKAIITTEGKNIAITVPPSLMHPKIKDYLVDKLGFILKASSKEENYTFLKELQWLGGTASNIPKAAALFSHLTGWKDIPDDCKEKAIENAIAEAEKYEYGQTLYPVGPDSWKKWCATGEVAKVPHAATKNELEKDLLDYLNAHPGIKFSWKELKGLVKAANPQVKYPGMFSVTMAKLFNLGKVKKDDDLYYVEAPVKEVDIGLITDAPKVVIDQIVSILCNSKNEGLGIGEASIKVYNAFSSYIKPNPTNNKWLQVAYEQCPPEQPKISPLSYNEVKQKALEFFTEHPNEPVHYYALGSIMPDVKNSTFKKVADELFAEGKVTQSGDYYKIIKPPKAQDSIFQLAADQIISIQKKAKELYEAGQFGVLGAYLKETYGIPWSDKLKKELEDLFPEYQHKEKPKETGNLDKLIAESEKYSIKLAKEYASKPEDWQKSAQIHKEETADETMVSDEGIDTGAESGLKEKLLHLINGATYDFDWTPEYVQDELEDNEIPHDTNYEDVIYPALMELVDEGKITYDGDEQTWHSKMTLKDVDGLKKLLPMTEEEVLAAMEKAGVEIPVEEEKPSNTLENLIYNWLVKKGAPKSYDDVLAASPGYDPDNVLTTLEALVSQGLVSKAWDGNKNMYEANPVPEEDLGNYFFNATSELYGTEEHGPYDTVEEAEIGIANIKAKEGEDKHTFSDIFQKGEDFEAVNTESTLTEEPNDLEYLKSKILNTLNKQPGDHFDSPTVQEWATDNWGYTEELAIQAIEELIAEHKVEEGENEEGVLTIWVEVEKPIKSYEDFALNYLKENQGATYVASEVYEAYENAGYKVSESGAPSGIAVMGETLVEMALKGKIGSKEKKNEPILFYWVPELIKPKKELHQLPPGDLAGIEKGIYTLAGQGKSTGDIIDTITEYYNLVGSASLKGHIEDIYEKYLAAKKNLEAFLSENPGLHYKSPILTDASGEDVMAAKAATYALNQEGKLDIIPGTPADTETAYGWKKTSPKEEPEEQSHSIEAGIQEEAMANFIKQGMSANAVAELFSGGTYPQNKLLSTANKLYALYHPMDNPMTKPVGSLPSWAFNKMNSIAENMLAKGKTQEDTAWYIAFNYNLVKSDVAALVKELAKKPIIQQKQLLETTIKILQPGEVLAGCNVEISGLSEVAPSTVAYCQGVIKPVKVQEGEKPSTAQTGDKGKQVNHSTWTQVMSLITETNDNSRSKLTYASSGGESNNKRTEAVSRVLEEFGFECEKEQPWKLKCNYTMKPDLNLSIDDQDNIRKAAIFLSSIDKVGKLPLTCIPKAIEYAKEHARGINKTGKPWTNYVFPETVEEWMKTVCEKV